MIAPMTLRIVERRKYLFMFAMSDETEHFRKYRPKNIPRIFEHTRTM